MADELAKAGLYFDEFNKIRILDPVVSSQTNDLIEYNKKYSNYVQNLENSIDSFVSTLEGLGRNVDKEKMKAIGLRNSLKSIVKDREHQKQKLQAFIMEKTMELERLQLELHSLQLVEVEQQEIIEYLSEMRITNDGNPFDLYY